ncbi:MAG TPA: SRPBCC domain-containing protein [Cyclobacteriaceae bacterium]|nr:SRPBCC domain-containing protein [Cyclobacteriaceae bacterium]
MSRSIKHQFFFPHSPQKVWDYLTKPELMEKWLMKTNFVPLVGHEFQFKTNAIPSLNFDGVFYCKVLEIVPLEKLSYTWQSGPGNGEITLDSVVTWKLESTNNGTQLFLDHSGFQKEENLAFYNGLTDGWLKNLKKIDNLLNVLL